MNKNLWIDTDLSVGMKRHIREGYCDVDDGYAILQLFKSEAINIHGMSAVFGNTKLEDAFSLIKKMSNDFAKTSIPCFKGAEKSLELENIQSNEAVEAIATVLRKQKLRILAIGPATNVGILLLKYPDLAQQIEEVILVAGRRKETDYFKIGNQGNHAHDLNFDLDNTAFEVLLQSGCSVTLCPFEISSKVWITENDLEKIDNGEKGNQWLIEHSKPWLQQWIQQGAKGFNPFDLLASHYILYPEDIIAEPLRAKLEVHLDDREKDNPNQHFKNYLLCQQNGHYHVNYCYDVVEDYHEKLIQSLIKKTQL